MQIPGTQRLLKQGGFRMMPRVGAPQAFGAGLAQPLVIQGSAGGAGGAGKPIEAVPASEQRRLKKRTPLSTFPGDEFHVFLERI